MKKKSKKRKILFIIIILVVFSLSYVTVAALNYVPLPGVNSIIRYPKSQNIAKLSIGNLFLEFDLNSTIIEEVGELDLDVELVIYGIKNNHATNVFNWYEWKYNVDGWELYKSSSNKGDGWELYYGIWTKGIMIQATVVGEGTILDKYTDYDVFTGTALTNGIAVGLL